MSSFLKNNLLLKYSSILFLGNVAGGFFNYLYHLVMGRMLGPADYGVLASLLSIFYLIGVPTSSIMLVTANYTSTFKAHQAFHKIKHLFNYFTRKLFLLSIICFFIFLIFSPYIASFLKIAKPSLLLLLSTAFLITFLVPINRGLLKGLHDFKSDAWSTVVEFSAKFVIAVILVWLNLRVFGALTGILLGLVLTYLYTFYPLRTYLFNQPEQDFTLSMQGVIKYSIPMLISLFCLTLFYTSDVLLAKHYFTEQEAGLYSALSALGKIIYFVSAPIALVMFPMVAEKKAKNESHTHLLHQALLLVFGISLITVVLYFIFPIQIIRLLFGQEYLQISPYMGFFALGMGLFAFNNTLVNYFLSLKDFKFLPILVFFSLLQIVLILLWHGTIMHLIYILLGVNFTLLLSLYLIYLSSVVKNLFSP